MTGDAKNPSNLVLRIQSKKLTTFYLCLVCILPNSKDGVIILQRTMIWKPFFCFSSFDYGKDNCWFISRWNLLRINLCKEIMVCTHSICTDYKLWITLLVLLRPWLRHMEDKRFRPEECTRREPWTQAILTPAHILIPKEHMLIQYACQWRMHLLLMMRMRTLGPSGV